jgi:tetratricopeptide (TPR) repeat protein
VIALAVLEWFGGMGMINRTLNNFALREFTLKERLLSEMRIVFHYLGLLLVPDPERLTLYNDCYPISRSFFQPWSTAASCLGLILIGVSLVFSLLSRSPAFLIYAFGILWYFANLIEESSFLCLELIFEHRTYLPSVGIFLIMSFWIVRLKRISIKWKHCVHLFLILFILLEIFGTVLRNQYWSNKALFNEHALERAPDSARVLSNLSIGYRDLGVMGVSREFLEKALEKKPEDIYLLVGYYLTLMDWKQEEGAKDILSKINSLLESGRYSASPNDILGLQILSEVFYDKIKDYKNSIKYCGYITKKLDTHTISFFKIGLAYLHLNQPEEAVVAFKKAVALKPDASDNNFFLGLAYKMSGRDREAISYAKKALALSPGPALIKEIYGIMRERVWSKKRSKGLWSESPYASGMILPGGTKPLPLDK